MLSNWFSASASNFDHTCNIPKVGKRSAAAIKDSDDTTDNVYISMSKLKARRLTHSRLTLFCPSVRVWQFLTILSGLPFHLNHQSIDCRKAENLSSDLPMQHQLGFSFDASLLSLDCLSGQNSSPEMVKKCQIQGMGGRTVGPELACFVAPCSLMATLKWPITFSESEPNNCLLS